MYTLSHTVDAARSLRGSLGEGIGEGVVAAASGSTMIRIHAGALLALQNFHLGRYPGMRIAAASSADTPLAVKIGKSALATLEIVPGVRARDVFASGWPDGFEGNMQIGRTPPLSANKAATHFPILRRETGVRYSSMLFFDDCNWGDHCGAVSRECVDDESGLGPVVVRTRVKYVPRVRAASNASTSVDFCEQYVRCTTTRSRARAKKRRRRV